MKRNRDRRRRLQAVRDLERVRSMLSLYRGPMSVVKNERDKEDLLIYLRGFDFALEKMREFA